MFPDGLHGCLASGSTHWFDIDFYVSVTVRNTWVFLEVLKCICTAAACGLLHSLTEVHLSMTEVGMMHNSN